MERDPFAPDAPDTQDVLDALDDPDCRTIIEHIDGAMTANDIADACDVPLSTTYRKLDLLSEASLLEEQVELRTDGRHTTRYILAFDEVRITLTEDNAIELIIEHRDQSPEERLSELWSEVQKET
ncbi:IclR family transcriptional regulator [Halogeometricum borinquense DSM 11551]|uniref:IclR family transcriptional regulator n=2 Tax=Halogeometricum borinquense TaxID=60847 RepID=E4NUW4_HALBP|nr:helix-turn-helix domain-containing protein [Halogeometricum borinquense]ADQ68953.1 IclR-like transcriptional regulator [Halogeometricum borinquense DSM 11551]ELY29123.1 IclR family transcriptional regulator [Halogeometricum borinquense DSM 11551]RYJ08144.1 ArsR family transcriptional regulator [Halogeometricum borinquense]